MATISWAPTKTELDEATARTEAVMSHPDPLVRYRAAAFEADMHHAFLARPGADAELQAEAEAAA